MVTVLVTSEIWKNVFDEGMGYLTLIELRVESRM